VARRRQLPAVALTLRTVVIQTKHTTLAIAFHRESDLVEIEPCHPTQPLHWNLPLAVGPLIRLHAHPQFRGQLLYPSHSLFIHIPLTSEGQHYADHTGVSDWREGPYLGLLRTDRDN